MGRTKLAVMFRNSEQEGECMGRIEPEKEIEKVVICYEDGEEKEMKKGFFCEMQPGEECLNLTFHMF